MDNVELRADVERERRRGALLAAVRRAGEAISEGGSSGEEQTRTMRYFLRLQSGWRGWDVGTFVAGFAADGIAGARGFARAVAEALQARVLLWDAVTEREEEIVPRDQEDL